jgi:PAS domain S-box-containing protein
MESKDKPNATIENKDKPIFARGANLLRRRLKKVNEQLTLTALQAQEEAEQSAGRYRDLVEGLDAIVWEARADPWQYTFLSQRAQTLFGYSIERWLTEPNFWMDLIHPDDRPLVVTEFQAATGIPRDFRVEFRAFAKDGRMFWLAMIARLRQDKLPRAHYRGLLLDIGDTMRAETLQKLVLHQTAELREDQEHLRALATELNLAEHRARTTLATDLHDHLAQLLVLGRLNIARAKHLPGLTPQLDELMTKTDDVLNTSLSYTRTLIADLSPPGLSESGLLPALRCLAEQMQQYPLHVGIEAPELPEPAIPEDQKLLLFQSVRELLINISKHARTDGAMVSIQYPTDHVRLEVRDEGCGFDSLNADTPTPTTTGDTATKNSSKFGLFSIRQRMKALGGGFELVSARGKGTTAALILPLTSKGSKNMTDVS